MIPDTRNMCSKECLPLLFYMEKIDPLLEKSKSKDFSNSATSNGRLHYKFPWVGAFQRKAAKAHKIDGCLLLHRASHYLCLKHQGSHQKKKVSKFMNKTARPGRSSLIRLVSLRSHLESFSYDDQSSGLNTEAPNTQMCWWKEGQVMSRIGIALEAKGTLFERE